MKFLIAYDITDNKLRGEIFKFLSDFGLNVQLSVFEVEIEFKKIHHFLKEIETTFSSNDKVFVYPMTKSSVGKFIKIGNQVSLNKGEVI
ncbi:MAG: CRISPR-associated endonuclease Cas2 [Candidatus Muiribacteriota bacterium]